MNYHDTIKLEINAVVVAGPRTFSAPADNGSGTLVAHVSDADNFSVCFDSLEFQSARLAGLETAQLTRIADALAKKLTYLLEPLRVVEIDGEAGAVQMRSHPPYQSPQQTRYYEVLVQRGGSLSLIRYEREQGQARRAIAAHVTNEVFLRLADDFATVVSAS